MQPRLPPRCRRQRRSEEHTSELQSRSDLVCRLLLEKKKTKLLRGWQRCRNIDIVLADTPDRFYVLLSVSVNRVPQGHVYLGLRMNFFFFLMIRRPPRSTLSLHDALPISQNKVSRASSLFVSDMKRTSLAGIAGTRSEEHTSELQSRSDLVCRLLLEK